MKYIVTPVTQASVEIMETWETRSIGVWLLVYIWIWKVDIWKMGSTDFLEKIVRKLSTSKLFHSEVTDKIDSSLLDISWEILLISNFTLYGSCEKWTKIDFWDGARFDESKTMYDTIVSTFQKNNISIKTWEFGAKMKIKSENLGPLNYIFEF